MDFTLVWYSTDTKSTRALYLTGCFLLIPLHFYGINHVSATLQSTSQVFILLPHIMWHKPWPGNQYEGWLALICMRCYSSRWHSAVWPLCALHCTFLQSLTAAVWVTVQCALCIVQCAVCIVQCAVCSVQCAVCSVQCAVCSVQCAVCSVQLFPPSRVTPLSHYCPPSTNPRHSLTNTEQCTDCKY